MANELSANVTKYKAGGSGDNIISDGYIKTVEKIWIDSCTMTSVATKTTIEIAVLPANKKVTGIDIIIETAISQTTGTIAIGFASDASVNSFLEASAISHNLSRTTISLPYGGVGVGSGTATGKAGTVKAGAFPAVTAGTKCTIAVQLDVWVASLGTIKSMVRYT